ncbi:hypothetical protein [Jeotgalibacillus salarius]|uniref:Uncharacterized protein n=1 Tax=Jeotgalibacillus salarius TaxID=546023 RepID=A0A4Y8LNI6_9BACL|nr:hypothetical protein [Jeotgalibacillus salarius]TFE04153.1 hypothetical protein E2626_02165 [Jeotgalibacillus salarius]
MRSDDTNKLGRESIIAGDELIIQVSTAPEPIMHGGDSINCGGEPINKSHEPIPIPHPPQKFAPPNSSRYNKPKEVNQMKKLYQWSNWKTWLVSLIIFAAFLGFILPNEAAESSRVTGTSESPDSSFLYTPETLFSIAEAYGEEGRQYYVRARYTFDVVWPIAYFLFLTTTLGILFKRIRHSKWGLVILLPLCGLVFDYLENLSTSLVMSFYPEQLNAIAAIAPLFTAVKWSCIYASFALIPIGVIVFLITRKKVRS